MMSQLHQAFGVYGIYTSDKSDLLVIHKTDGPYQHRYDLPGGTPEDFEGSQTTLSREFREETGLRPMSFQQLGLKSFCYPWIFEQTTFNQHRALFYRVNSVTGALLEQTQQFEGQDSAGATFIKLEALNSENSSPLVLTAKAYLETHTFDDSDMTLEHWTVL